MSGLDPRFDPHRDEDERFDRLEALGQARETEGENVSEAFYGSWVPLRLVPQGLSAGSSPAAGRADCVVCGDLGCEFCPAVDAA